MPLNNLKKARSTAEEVVKEAGKILVESKGKFSIKAYKDKEDIVTDVDIKIEKKVIQIIEKNFPKHNILSEEVGEIRKGSDFTWVIDPLDGTKEYIREIPLYCSAVVLQKNGVPIVSAIYDPELDELYSASLKNGATLNGKRISVSSEQRLDHSMLFTYLPKEAKQVVWLAPIFELLYRVRGHANHNMSYCWVAKGGYEGHFSIFTPTKWWDIAPGILILKEAGGKVSDLNNQEISFNNYKSIAIGTNGKIHKELVSQLNKVIRK
ncbi:inositol monophosphatase family protein [Patescibacteria group bacterium]